MTTFKRFLTLLLVSTLTLSVWGAEAEYVFNAADLTGTTLDGAANSSWSISAGTIAGYNASKGIQTTANTLTITSSDQYSNITKVVLDYSTNSSSTAKISVTAGSSTSAEQQVQKNQTNSTLTFNFTDVGDNKTVSITMKRNGTAGSLYVKKVIITYGSGSSYTITAESNNDSWGTVSGTTTITASPKSGYRVVSGDGGYTVTSGTATVTNNGDNTFSVSASTDCTVRINFEAIPSHTVTWSSNGDNSNTVSYQEGADINFPTSADGCDEKTFIGWSATTVAVTDVSPTLVSEATMGTSDITYYAVFADADGDAATLTKMVAGDNFTNGDNIVIVAHGTTVALYQETTNTSYVKKWTFDNDVETLAADNKKWITVSTATGGWYLGDATNGYLNNSSNSLYCDNDQSI